MDDRRFDEFGRRLADRYSRRGVLGLVAVAVAVLLPGRHALAQGDGRLSRCLNAWQSCSTERGAMPCCFGDCFDGVCCPADKIAVDHCCEEWEVPCGETCCPFGTIACGHPTVLPDGTVLPGTCVCPEETPYCNDVCCLSGLCCNGQCCGNMPNTVCLDGGCAILCTDHSDCAGAKGNAAACIDGLCCDEWHICGDTCCTEGECIGGECQITR